MVTAIWFLTKVPKTYVGEKTPSSTNGAGKTGYPSYGIKLGAYQQMTG
jgi:hypothetical protein